VDSFVPMLCTLCKGRRSLTHALEPPPPSTIDLDASFSLPIFPDKLCTRIIFASVLEELAWTVSNAQICPCLYVSVNWAHPAKSVFGSNTFLVVSVSICHSQKIMCVKTGEISPSQDLSLDPLQPQLAVCPAKIWSVLHTYHNYINPNI
jgi:hypothetical protein